MTQRDELVRDRGGDPFWFAQPFNLKGDRTDASAEERREAPQPCPPWLRGRPGCLDRAARHRGAPCRFGRCPLAGSGPRPSGPRWRKLWRSPQANEWDESARGPVAALLVFESAVLAGEASAWQAQEARYAAESLGLTPRSLAALGWRIVE